TASSPSVVNGLSFFGNEPSPPLRACQPPSGCSFNSVSALFRAGRIPVGRLGAEELPDEEVLHPPLAVWASHAMAPARDHEQLEVLAGFDESIDKSERRFRWNVR